MADMIATREAYGKALAFFGEKYKDVVVFDADLSGATKTDIFKKAFPDRHFNCGIAEGNMVSVAAGVAAAGKIPFVSSFAMFTAGRAFEQIRNAVGYPHLNVKIGATHAGISVGEDGATHQCNEDIATMRVIPGMTVICPADAVEAKAAVEAAILWDGPVYLRFGRAPVPVLFNEADYKFEIGKGIVMADGKDVTLVATGLMTHIALEARDILAQENISARVINMPTIKPIDGDLLEAAARETGAIVTAEEHSIIGGLGSAVTETLAERYPVPVRRVGINDKFGRSGKAGELLVYYGLTANNIAANAKKAIAAKK